MFPWTHRSYICPREPHVIGITLLPKRTFIASFCKSLPHSRYLCDTTGRLPKSALSASRTFLRSLTLAERRVRPSYSACVLLLCAPRSGFSAVSVALPVRQITRRRHSRWSSTATKHGDSAGKATRTAICSVSVDSWYEGGERRLMSIQRTTMPFGYMRL